MDMLLTLSVFNTLFAILLFSSSISTQSLYEDGDRSYNDFNAKSKEIALQTFQEKTEVRLEEKEVQFEKCKKREDFMSESYTILLKMINKGQFPQEVLGKTCPGDVHLNISVGLQTQVANLLDFTTTLRSIRDTNVYKEYLNYTTSLVALFGLPVSKIQAVCRVHPNLVFLHPDECQLYYNCSVTYGTVPTYLEQHMLECPYPSLFSTQTLQCENFTKVCCGFRKEFKEKCEYKLQSRNSFPISCEKHNPSCRNKSDGYHQGFQGINSFINCFKERLLNTGTCEDDAEWNIYKIPHDGKCTNPFKVLYKDGGFLSSCEGKANGNYRFEHDSYYKHKGDYFSVGRQCDAYYQCQGGMATPIKCPKGTVFESVGKNCKPGNHSIELGCQLYCNPDFTMPNGFPNNLAECPYPEQFSEDTQRCENFTKVSCDSRPQAKEICNYWVQRYTLQYVDCKDYFSSCAGLPDGFHEHPVKRPGPYYLICLQERVLLDGYCQTDTEWQAQTFPYNGTCTQQFAIPNSSYSLGLLPDCSGKDDGHYQYTSRPCDAYYKCDGGVATAVKCPPETSFDKLTGVCRAGAVCS